MWNIILICMYVFGCGLVHAFDHTLLEPLLKKYTRPITVLEIQTSAVLCCAPFLAKQYPGTFVALVKNDPENLIKAVHQDDIQNIVVANPLDLSTEFLTTLSRCEHFDLVIVPDILRIGKKSSKENLTLLLTLADHVCVCLTQTAAAHVSSVTCPYETLGSANNLTVYLFHPGKNSIQQPRWNKRTSSLQYTIKSTFNEKTLHKNNGPQGSNWTPGINLITFVMLNGLYPTDAIIREHLDAFREIQHNDLVIGNMVVQGAHIAPIDGNDQRRYLDQKLCLKAARSLFSWRKRFKDPEHELYKYSIYIQSHSKKHKKPAH